MWNRTTRKEVMEIMKYISTKDGIFDIEKYGGIRTIVKIYDADESLRLKYENTNESQQVGDRFVIIENKDYKITDNNTADTIEELCDGLIIEDKDNTNNWFVMEIIEYQSKDNVDKKYMVDRWNFYAFIKTDKGLIYVAKMNDKGELELL